MVRRVTRRLGNHPIFGWFHELGTLMGALSWLFTIVTPFTNRLSLLIVHGAPCRSEAAASVQSMGALILALVGPQVDAVTAASIGLLDDGIEHHPADALAPSIRNNVDQAQEPLAQNHITASAIRAERM